MKTSLNFGALKDTIAKKAAFELTQNSKTDILKEFTDVLKVNPTLNRQYLIFKNFERVKPFSKERLAERFIAQNLEALNGLAWRDILKENIDLRKKFLGNPDESHVFAKKENADLYENLNVLIESKLNTTFNDFEKEATAYNAIVEHLTRPVEQSEKNKESKEQPDFHKFWRFVTKNALNSFNERYEGLTPEEQSMFKLMISNNSDKKLGVIKLKTEIAESIQNKINQSHSKEEQVLLEAFSQKLNREMSDDEMLKDECISSLFELRETLKSM